ncbi:hypothetical protein [Streptosporangium saharense]|uniref:ABC-2 type transport system permease protein n=1 Tax=Streptosporangium saharense TaxID=1706840 RepID=A0A7W7VP23_9ACTN|nr:hypothetical protein [Streptosporangium saharense]MBB4917521.1 ABC-2 type transport system permease protein [Streptosporangium saharense]
MRAEFTRIRTLPATWIALAVTLAANTLLGLLAATDTVRVATSDGQVAVSQLGTVMLAPVYAFLAVPVFAAGRELRISLLATPDRNRFLLAKLLASAGTTIVAAPVLLLPGLLVRHAAGSLPAEMTAYLLLGLVGGGFAVLTRTAVIPLAVLLALPVLVSPMLAGLLPGLVRLLPHEATLSFLGTSTGPALSRTAGFWVLLAWAVVFVGAAWVATVRRDS